jgi:sugar O-acyltransferase (sialic acid O-acetyltransferase NeuD family)
MGAPVWIVGGSGCALEAWAVARASGVPVAGFVNVTPAVDFDREGLAVMAESEFLAGPASTAEVTLAIGSPRLRAKLARTFAERGATFRTLVHPTSVVGPACVIGAGSILMAMSVLETHVQLGQHTLLNVGATVAHEGRIGPATSLGPGVHLAGRVQVGARCDLGVGAVARPGVRIGDDVVVGAGAAVVRDLLQAGTYVGVPARRLSAGS